MSGSKYKSVFVKLTDKPIATDCKPSTFILDNKIFNKLKAKIKKYNIAYQLEQPAQHRKNAAERAIRIYKNHFIAGLASISDILPMSEWDRLIEQAVLTIN